MDLDETVDETQDERPLRGFRRRWTSDVAALDEPSPGHISEGVGEDLNLESQPHLFSGSNVDSMEFDQHALDWDFIGHTCDSEEAGPDETLKRALEIDEDLTEPSTCPQVLDPLGTEPSWKAAALTAEVKRARSDFVKLPWEMEGSVFKSRDLWQGTIVSSLDKMFTPSAIGAVVMCWVPRLCMRDLTRPDRAQRCLFCRSSSRGRVESLWRRTSGAKLCQSFVALSCRILWPLSWEPVCIAILFQVFGS